MKTSTLIWRLCAAFWRGKKSQEQKRTGGKGGGGGIFFGRLLWAHQVEGTCVGWGWTGAADSTLDIFQSILQTQMAEIFSSLGTRKSAKALLLQPGEIHMADLFHHPWKATCKAWFHSIATMHIHSYSLCRISERESEHSLGQKQRKDVYFQGVGRVTGIEQGRGYCQNCHLTLSFANVICQSVIEYGGRNLGERRNDSRSLYFPETTAQGQITEIRM